MMPEFMVETQVGAEGIKMSDGYVLSDEILKHNEYLKNHLKKNYF